MSAIPRLTRQLHELLAAAPTLLMAVAALLLISPLLPAQEVSLDPPELDFGRIRVSSDRCRSVIFINHTAAPLVLHEVRNPAAPFPATFPDTIPSDTGAYVDLCFEPRGLGPDSAVVTFIYETDGLDSIRLPVRAFGWDSLSLGIGVTVTGKPGSIIEVPVRVFDDIPAEYDIRSYRFALRFNKTMLYPIADVSGGASLTAGMEAPTVQMIREVDARLPQVEYRVRGATPLNNPAPDSVLVNLRFLVLHGNAMSTDLTLVSAGFSDGAPLGGVFLKGRFIADSLCFQDLRLVDIPDRDMAADVGGYPNPFSHATLIQYHIGRDAPVRLTVHSMLGREVAVLDEGLRPAGLHAVRFDGGSLPEGIYFCRLAAGNVIRTSTIMLVR